MARVRKPFEQYSKLLPDGRHVVSVVIFEPVRATVWVVAESKREALAKIREIGAPEPHIQSDFRPGGAAVDAAMLDPDGGVFVREFLPYGPQRYLPLAGLANYLNGRELAH